MTKIHAHKWIDAAGPLSIQIIPSRCACGQTRLELVHPGTGRRTGIALPLDVVQVAAAGRQALDGAKQIYEMGANVLDALRRMGVVR